MGKARIIYMFKREKIEHLSYYGVINSMDKNTLEEFISQGLSSYKIAIATGKSQTAISYWLKKHGIKTLRKRNAWTAEERKKHKYQKNTHKQRQRALERKIYLVKEGGNKCCKCGYDKNLSALDFHHVNPEDKSFPLDLCSLGHFSLESCIIESKKCIIVCANCHRELHNPEFDTNKIGGSART